MHFSFCDWDQQNNQRKEEQIKFTSMMKLQKDQRSNFVAETSKISENYGIPYEYGSVMHYRNHEYVNVF